MLAFIGILLYMCKSEKKKGVGTILIGFAVLMTGMTAMSNAVLPLQDEAWFTSLFTRFSNPLLAFWWAHWSPALSRAPVPAWVFCRH